MPGNAGEPGVAADHLQIGVADAGPQDAKKRFSLLWLRHPHVVAETQLSAFEPDRGHDPIPAHDADYTCPLVRAEPEGPMRRIRSAGIRMSPTALRIIPILAVAGCLSCFNPPVEQTVEIFFQPEGEARIDVLTRFALAKDNSAAAERIDAV